MVMHYDMHEELNTIHFRRSFLLYFRFFFSHRVIDGRQ